MKAIRKMITGIISCIMLLAGSGCVTAFAEGDEVTAKIPVAVTANGADAAGSVVITAKTDGAPMPENPVLDVKGTGEYVILYDQASEYEYEITEKASGSSGVINDEAKWDVKVWTGYDESNQLYAVVTIHHDGSAAKSDTVLFKNTIKTKPAAPLAASAPPAAQNAVHARNTGDARIAWPWIAGMAAGVCVLVIILTKRKRNAQE